VEEPEDVELDPESGHLAPESLARCEHGGAGREQVEDRVDLAIRDEHGVRNEAGGDGSLHDEVALCDEQPGRRIPRRA
jgi:hypothetical protein